MDKPEVLEMVEVHPGTTAELEEAYVVHKLWLADDQDAFDNLIGKHGEDHLARWKQSAGGVAEGLTLEENTAADLHQVGPEEFSLVPGRVLRQVLRLGPGENDHAVLVGIALLACDRPVPPHLRPRLDGERGDVTGLARERLHVAVEAVFLVRGLAVAVGAVDAGLFGRVGR